MSTQTPDDRDRQGARRDAAISTGVSGNDARLDSSSNGQPLFLSPIFILQERSEANSPRRILIAFLGAILYHLLAISFLVFAPGPGARLRPPVIADLSKAVPLYLPKELTQKDPNRGKISHELDVRSLAPPAPIPTVPRIAPPATQPVPTPAPRTVVPAPVPQIEPPKVEVAAAPPPPAAGKPPETPATEQPKLAFESVGANGTSPRQGVDPRIKLPQIKNSIEEAMNAAVQPPGATTGSVVMGDVDASKLQLLSDPGGVDFKPYLIQVLSAVRNNWLAVVPESARMGRRGRVLIQFIIDRRGRMPKIVIAEESGTFAFDRAAIAGVNASVPFPPLPTAYKGDEIRLQLAFTYNLPSR